MQLDIEEFNPLAKLELDGREVAKEIRQDRKHVGGSSDSFATDSDSNHEE